MAMYKDEVVFSKNHELHNVIVYDAYAGMYYNKQTDLYLTLEEFEALRKEV